MNYTRFVFNMKQLIEILNFKDFIRKTVTNKVLRDKAFNIAKISKYDGYQEISRGIKIQRGIKRYQQIQRGMTSVVYNYFDEESSGGAITRARSKPLIMGGKFAIKSEVMPKQQLVEELHKPIIRKFEKQKVYSFLKTKIGVLIQQICN